MAGVELPKRVEDWKMAGGFGVVDSDGLGVAPNKDEAELAGAAAAAASFCSDAGFG